MKRTLFLLGLLVVSYTTEAQQFLLFPGNSGSSNITWLTADVAIDQQGNKIIVGSVNNSGIHDFLPGPDSLQIAPSEVAAHFRYSGFIASYSPEGELNYLLNIKDEDIPTDIRLQQVDVDAQGNCYVLGTLFGKADLDPGPGVFELQAPNTISQIAFIAAYTNSGELIYALPLGMTTLTDAFYEESYRLRVDDEGNTYLALEFPDSDFDFDPGTGEYVPLGNHVFSYTPSGAFRFAYPIPRVFFDLTIDDEGNQYIIGDLFNGTDDDFDFDPGPDTLSIISDSSSFYFSSYAADGTLRFVKKVSTVEINQTVFQSSAFSGRIALGPNGNIWIVGSVPSGTTIDFDPGPSSFELTVSSFDVIDPADLFLAHYTNIGGFIDARIFNEEVGNSAREQLAELEVGVDNTPVFVAAMAGGLTNFGSDASPFFLSGGVDSGNFGDTPFDLLVAAFDAELQPKMAYVLEDSRVSIRPELAVSKNCPNYVITGNIQKDVSLAIENTIRPFGVNTFGGDKDNMFLLTDLYAESPLSECEISPFVITSTEEKRIGIVNTYAYPNPTSGRFQIRMTGASILPTHFSLHNQLGQKVTEFIINETSMAIDISRLSSGIYYLRSQDVKMNSIRIVKQ